MNFKIPYNRTGSLKEYCVNIIKMKNKYENFAALKNINLEIKKGEVIGLVGKNGSGKSTLLKIISGIIEPTRGKVEVNGNIAPLLELGMGFDGDLTGKENIYLNGAILGYTKDFIEKKLEEIYEFSELGKFIHIAVRNYSTGMFMRLAFSIATVVEPDILIIDELLAVGDEGFQTKCKNRIKELINKGTTVILVSHTIAQIEELCNRVIWLDKGKIKMQGDTKEVCDSYRNFYKEV
jgi:ABC-type polysaccharide/polyol phosphate transport system ATPase subunit